jgi:oligopeptide/dipeptide ABC transporter ATP-binding protein
VNEVVLEVEGLTAGFSTEDGVVQSVRGVDLSLRRGECIGLVGESGSGKSVTSLAILGLLPRNANVTGSVRLRGQELLGLDDRSMSALRGKSLAMIFQDPMTSLNPVYRIGYQIAETLQAHRPMSRQAARARSIELLETVGIPSASERVDAYPHELSGGMRQRVVIAIAMANNPDVIIADEPTTALDVTVQAQVLDALQTARTQTGAALILITHDLGVIAGHADRVCVMYAGRIVESGTVDEVFYTPRAPYTMGLLGSLPRIDESGRRRLTPIVGSPPSLLNLAPGCPFTPRCPLARERCETDEPDLTPVQPAAGHRSACHYSSELIGARVEDVFTAGEAA